MNLFNLDQPVAPRFIRVLYIIAVVIVAIGMIRGVVGGVMTIIHPPMPRADRAAAIVPPPGAPANADVTTAAPNAAPADANATPAPAAGTNAASVAPPAPAANANAAPVAPPRVARGQGRGGRAGFNRGLQDRRFAMRGGMRRRGMMMGGMMRRLGPTGFGIFRIVAALVRGIILIMILRVLSEVGLAVLAVGRRAKEGGSAV
jgi:hypothetical protein